MLRKIRLEDMVRVSFDALEKVVVSSIEQFGDDRRVASALCSSSTVGCHVAPNQDVCCRQLNTGESVPSGQVGSVWMETDIVFF